MLRKITLPLLAAGFVFVGMFGASDEEIDAHAVSMTPTVTPSISPTTPTPLGTPTPVEMPTPIDDPNYPKKPHPAPTMVP